MSGDPPILKPVFGQESGIRRVDYDKPGPCKHRTYEVDEQERTVSCRCGAILDPFEVLLEYARRERHWRHYDSAARKATGTLREAEEELKRVQARTRSALRKDAEEAVRMERRRQERERQVVSNAVWRIRQESEKVERAMRRLAEGSGAGRQSRLPNVIGSTTVSMDNNDA